MSNDDIKTIFSKLDSLAEGQAEIRTNQKWVMEEQRAQKTLLAEIMTGGCARYAEHVATSMTVKDLAKDVKSLQGDRAWVMGAASVLSVIGSSITGVLFRVFGK